MTLTMNNHSIMKRILTILLIFSILCCGCHQKKSDNEVHQAPTSETLSLESVATFARMLEQSVNNDSPAPDMINNAFDKAAFREKLSRDSEVASALDLNFGQEILDGNLNYGDRVASMIDGGGDFRFDTCYQAGKEFHVVFRLYDTLGETHFDDYTVALRNNELKIVEGFSFDYGCKLTTKIASEIMYNALKTMGQLDASAQTMEKIVELNKAGKYGEMMTILQAHQELALHYPAYNLYYLIAIRNASSNYIADLHKLRQTGVNERFILAHELSYYSGTNDFKAITNTIDSLIKFTGDDPVFCIQAAKTLKNAKRYEDALQFYNVAKAGMPYLWDIWKGELDCYRRLNDETKFNSCLEAGKQLYGLNDAELADIKKDAR